MSVNYNKIAGTCLLALGVAILLATLFLGYGMYSAVMRTGANNASQNQTNVAVSNTIAPSMSTIVGAVVSVIVSKTPFATYVSYIAAVIILALFASIGYKISLLGTHMLSIGSGKNTDKR
jgi:uncharacterized membrane protein